MRVFCARFLSCAVLECIGLNIYQTCIAAQCVLAVVTFAREIRAHVGGPGDAYQACTGEQVRKGVPVVRGADQACGLKVISALIHDFPDLIARQWFDQDVAHHGGQLEFVVL